MLKKERFYECHLLCMYIFYQTININYNANKHNYLHNHFALKATNILIIHAISEKRHAVYVRNLLRQIHGSKFGLVS